MIYLLCHPSCRCFIPFLQNFEFLLKRNGIPAEFRLSYDPAQDNGSDLWLIIWNGLTILPRRCLIYNMDPMVPHIEAGLRALIQRSPHATILKLVDYCYGLNSTRWSDLPYPRAVLIYGFSPYHLEQQTLIMPGSPPEQNIDILFYGNVTGRRLPMICQLSKLAQARNYILMVRHYDLFDETEKIKTIARAKIVVSFGSADTLAFKGNDLARSAQVISMGGLVITEYLGDPVVEPVMATYVPHYRTTEELLYLVDYYLSHPEERQQKRLLARDRLAVDFNLEKDLLQLITSEI